MLSKKKKCNQLFENKHKTYNFKKYYSNFLKYNLHP